ncbi:MAG TPA: NAD(P)H-hydrate dehydratase [Candidatus Binatia bacterium]
MLVTAAQMRELDRRTIELGTPGEVLMERAGAGIAAALLRRHRAACARGVVVVSGRGNNGGDGFVVARLLKKRGHRCEVVLLGRLEELEGDARLNAERWTKMRGRTVELETLDEHGAAELERRLSRAGVVVDGIFGTGLARPVEGLAAQVVEVIERAARGEASPDARPARGERGAGRETSTRGARRTRPVVVAIDLPSGLDADSGEALGVAVRADLTVTLGALKPGLVAPAGRVWAGEVELVDIGLAPEAIEAVGPYGEIGDAAMLAPLLPPRHASSHKGTHGHLLVVAGSRGKTGAAILCGRGALRGGAGLVTVACTDEVLPIIASSTPELMTEPYGRFSADEWRARLDGKAAVAVGPGLGTSDAAVELVRWLVREAGVPLVVDADGLNALARDTSVLREAKHGVVLTPHPGEMARLVGSSTKDVQARRIEVARTLARDTGAVVVLKGSGTITAAPDGRWTLNTSGNPILGTGGTGDVLAGLLGSLLAQHLEPYDAARLAVFLHGAAGDRLAERLGDAGLLASELADELPLVRHALRA